MRSRSVLALSVIAAVTLLLPACASLEPSAGSRPAPDATLTAACPSQGEGSAPSPTTCARFDGEQAMRENERYRDRAPLPPSATTAAQPDLERVRTALTARLRSGEPTEPGLRSTLQRLGFAPDEVQTDGLRFGVETGGGCVFGAVDRGSVTIAFGGFIADGGCLALSGH